MPKIRENLRQGGLSEEQIEYRIDAILEEARRQESQSRKKALLNNLEMQGEEAVSAVMNGTHTERIMGLILYDLIKIREVINEF